MITKQQVKAIVEALIDEAEFCIVPREPERREWRIAKAEARRQVRALDSKRSK